MKKFLKIMVLALLVAAMTLSLTGCGEEKKAENAVAKMFEAFQGSEFEEAKNYVNFDALSDGATGEMDLKTEMLMKNLFDRLEYKILSSQKIDGNKVEVAVEITAVDMKPVMQDYLKRALEYVFSNMGDSQPTDEEMEKKMEEFFVESASQPDLETVTNEVVVAVVKEDKDWKVQPDEEFVNALFGGLREATEDLSANFE